MKFGVSDTSHLNKTQTERLVDVTVIGIHRLCLLLIIDSVLNWLTQAIVCPLLLPVQREYMKS